MKGQVCRSRHTSRRPTATNAGKRAETAHAAAAPACGGALLRWLAAQSSAPQLRCYKRTRCPTLTLARRRALCSTLTLTLTLTLTPTLPPPAPPPTRPPTHPSGAPLTSERGHVVDGRMFDHRVDAFLRIAVGELCSHVGVPQARQVVLLLLRQGTETRRCRYVSRCVSSVGREGASPNPERTLLADDRRHGQLQYHGGSAKAH